MTTAGRLVAVVLPPNEGFSPEAAGAISLIIQRLGTAPSAFRTTVLGSPLRYPPFPEPSFQPVRAPIWLPGSRGSRYAWAVTRALRRLAPELIEVHNRPRLALHLAERFPGTPVALFLHNDPQGMRGMASPAQRASLRYLARVLVVSPYVRDRLMDGVQGRWAAAPVVVPNPVDLAATPAPLPPEQREHLILFAGRLVPEKGASTFVAACAQALPSLPGWRAEVIGARRLRPGADRDGYAAGVRQAAQAAGVHASGHQPHGAVLHAMSRAAIVAVPSVWPEPFGLTALEAMAGGAVLVCSAQGNLPALVGDAAVLVPPGDAAALAAALMALAEDAPRRAALGRAGVARAAGFDVTIAAEALDRVRAGILGLQSFEPPAG